MKECCSDCQVVPCAFDLLHDDVISGDPEKQVLGEKEEGVSGLPAAQGLPHTVRLKLQRTSYKSGQSKHKTDPLKCNQGIAKHAQLTWRMPEDATNFVQ